MSQWGFNLPPRFRLNLLPLLSLPFHSLPFHPVLVYLLIHLGCLEVHEVYPTNVLGEF